MKRSAFVLLCLFFLLTSCRGEDAITDTYVFSESISSDSLSSSLTAADTDSDTERTANVPDTEKAAYTSEDSDPLMPPPEKPVAPISIRVGTYNIKTGYDVGYNMDVIAADIEALELDIVGLQEVDIGTSRAGGLDTLKLLAEAAGYEYYAFFRAIYYRGGEYGTAILSRYPILSVETHRLPTPQGMEERSLGHARIDIGGVSVDMFNTHLSYEDKQVRAEQLSYIESLTAQSDIFIVTADFNIDSTDELSLVADSICANGGRFLTYNKTKPLDDILLSNGWSIKDKGVLDCTGHSDHDIFYVEIYCEI